MSTQEEEEEEEEEGDGICGHSGITDREENHWRSGVETMAHESHTQSQRQEKGPKDCTG